MKKIFFVILTVVSFLIIVFWFFLKEERLEVEKSVPADLNIENISIEEIEIKNKNEIQYVEKNTPSIEEPDNVDNNNLPKSKKIIVPFTSQSPYGVWDEKHEEACEEASLLMVVKYLSGEKLTPKISEKELQKMVDFQIKESGDYKDSDMEEVIELAKKFYKLDNLEVIYDFKKEKIKEELAKGNPIIVPTAGRLLENPYFTPPGPLYHNLVLTGYNGDLIITNDSGTKRGEGYVYDIDILYNAIHDFTGEKEDIEKGRKAMIIISL